MKKFIALMCVFTLLCSMPVLASSVTTEAVVASTASNTPSVAAEEGFSSNSDYQAATDRGMSAGEYYNNAVSTVKGLDNIVPMGQGGKIIINGVPTNLAATLSKVNDATVSNAKGQAAFFNGSLMNIFNVKLPGANFLSAVVNFYVVDLTADTKVVVRQLVNGEWIDVEITELRTDHIVLNLKNSGPVAFVKVS